MKRNIFIILAVLIVAVIGTSANVAERPKVYINPGHGGHTSNDRNVVIAPFAAGDTAGYWESNSNMWKAFALNQLLRWNGYSTAISRVKNDEEDDLALSTIVRLSNESGADIFYSIHSNATGQPEGYRINYPLGLYRGYTGEAEIENSDVLAETVMKRLITNRATVWTSNNYYLYGDWSFYKSWGDKVGLGVLRGNRVVSMLSEGSFHDYIPETYRLMSPYYCWVEGWHFYLATEDYFGFTGEDQPGLISGNIRDERILRNATYVMKGDDVLQPVNGATARLLDMQGNVLDVCQVDNMQNGIYLFKDVEPGTYQIEVTEPEHFSQTKEVTVNAHSTTYQNFYLKRVRNTPPEVVSYSPMWNEGDPALLCSTPIVLQFNWDMDIESVKNAFSVEPAVEGTIKWEDTNYRMVFTPTDAYEVNTLYTVHLDKSAKHGGGTEMENDFEFKFYTQGRNHLNVLAMFPDEGDKVHYKSGAYVEFRTDSLLDAHDLYTHFHVYDKAGEELDFNKRNIKNNKKGDPYGYIRLPLLKALTPGDEYKFVVDNDLCDTVGIHLPAELSVNFTATDASLDAPEGSEVVDDFETMTLAVDDQFSEDVKTSTLSLATDAMSGSKSLQLKYEFTSPNSGKMRFNYPQAEASPRLLDNTDMVFVKGQTLGISVNGDMSYNTLYGIFEHEGMEEIVPLTQITYHGWRYCNVALDMLPDDVPCKLVGFEFEKNATLMGSSGTVKFDALMREPTSGISTTTLLGVHVGPNPASEYLVAEADCYISGVELLDGNGRVIARHAGNFINVSNIASGVYFMRVWVNGLSSTHKVVVSH